MGVATVAIGLIPSEASIGVWAPVLLVIFRLLQGFSVGGEYAGSTSFLVEYANPRRRGLVGSIQSISVFVGSLSGSLSGFLISSVLSKEEVLSYGWRIPFLAGGVLAAIALYMRLKLEETPAFRAIEAAGEIERAPLLDVFKERWRNMLQIFFVAIYFTVSYYIVLTYAPTFLQKEAGVALSTSLLATSLAILIGIPIVAGAGGLSDRVGRRPLLLAAAVLTIVVAYPAFAIMKSGTTIAAILGLLLIMVPTSVLYGVGPTMFAEQMPTRLRYAGMSIPYNLATTIFGGFAALIATFLIERTGDSLSPSFYVIGAAVVALLALLTIKETAKSDLQ